MKFNLFLFLWLVLITCCSLPVKGQIVTTIGGNGNPGYTGDNAAATLATLDTPTCIAVDAIGNVYVNDQENNCVRKIVASSGIIVTVAGNGIPGFGGDGGPATAAMLNLNWGIALDAAGNLYITDQVNLRVRKVNPAGIITTIAGNGGYGLGGDGGQATAAQFMRPIGIATDPSGNIYVGDQDAYKIRKITPSGIISTVAGNNTNGYSGDGGSALSAQLAYTFGLSTDNASNLYICDGGNNCVRKVDASGIITTIAGNGSIGYGGDNGPATNAYLNSPTGVCADALGNVIIADCHNDRIRKINTDGIIGNIGGTGSAGFNGDGLAATATQFNRPVSVWVDDSGKIFFSDLDNMRVRTIHKVLSFYKGHQQFIHVCEGQSTQVDSELAIVDHTNGRIIRWDTVKGPRHGHLTTIPHYGTSSGGFILPTGLSYTSDGTSSFDSIIIRVNDGADTCITKINIAIDQPLSYAGVITGPSGVCVGQVIVLTDTTGNGIWSMSNLNAIISNGVVTGESPGLDTVFYTLSNACGRVTDTAVISVYALPNAGKITGDSLLCINESAKLSDSIPGGVWSRTNYIVGLTINGFITGALAGIDTIHYSVTDDRCNNKTSYFVTVDPFPTAHINLTRNNICLGDTTAVYGIPAGGIFEITNDLVTISGNIITGNSLGSDTIGYAYSDHCGTDTATAIITIDSIPDVPDILQNDNYVYAPAGFSSYQWLLNGVPIGGAIADSYLVTVTGYYSVIIRNKFGCPAVSPQVACNGCTPDNIRIYPNPTEGIVYLQWCKQLNIKLLCIDGKEIYIEKKVNYVDISELPDGVYILLIFDEDGNKIKTKRIVKTPNP